jgi:hypothetical protein
MISLSTVKASGILAGPPPEEWIIVAQPKANQRSDRVVNSAGKSKWLKSGVRVTQYASKLVIVEPLRYGASRHVDHKPDAPKMVTQNAICSALVDSVGWRPRCGRVVDVRKFGQ